MADEEEKIELTPEEIAIAREVPVEEVIAEQEESNPDKELPTAVNETDATEPPVEEEPEDTVAGDEDEIDSEPDDDSSWINDEVRQQAASYGLQEEDLSALGGLAEFQQAGRLLDIQALRWMAGQEPEPKQEEKVEEKQTGKIDPEKFSSDDYDENTIALVKAIRDQQDEMESFKKAAAEREHATYIDSFHDAVDTYNPEFYGNSVSESGLPKDLSGEENSRRERLFQSLDIVTESIIRQQKTAGQPIHLPPQSVLMGRADRLAFADEHASREQTERTKKIKAQSRKRRPVSSSAGATSNKTAHSDDEDEAVSIANDPAIVDFWKRAQEANGAV